MPFSLERDDDVFVLRMDDTENRFNPSSVSELNELLDKVDTADPPCALVTVGTGKYYSTGLDLDWVQTGGAGSLDAVVAAVEALIARTLVLRRPTVAAINGHCFAAAAVWSLAHDIRFMRADRGYWCVPEVQIGVPFTDGAAALLKARLHPQTAHEAMTTGRRYGGTDAREHGIVEHLYGEDELLPQAVQTARRLAELDPDALASTKSTMYRDVAAMFAGDRPASG